MKNDIGNSRGKRYDDDNDREISTLHPSTLLGNVAATPTRGNVFVSRMSAIVSAHLLLIQGGTYEKPKIAQCSTARAGVR